MNFLIFQTVKFCTRNKIQRQSRREISSLLVIAAGTELSWSVIAGMPAAHLGYGAPMLLAQAAIERCRPGMPCAVINPCVIRGSLKAHSPFWK